LAYDELGEISIRQHTREGLVDENGFSIVYSEEVQSNEFGSPLAYIFPDRSASQRITYNGRGFLDKLFVTEGTGPEKEFADFGDYNAADQMRRKALGNGVVTRYDYNNTRTYIGS
jgi:hypothetical protein